MPITLVSDPGAANANTFATLDEYKAYWAAHPFNTAALAAVDEDIKASLVMTGKALNSLIIWTGSAATATQSMTWPRIGMSSRNGFSIPSDVNPQDLKDAQCEWAGQYISSDLFQTNSVQQQGISSIKAGPVAITYKSSSASSIEILNADLRRQLPELAYVSSAVPDFVRNLLVPSWYTRELLAQPIIFEAHR